MVMVKIPARVNFLWKSIVSSRFTLLTLFLLFFSIRLIGPQPVLAQTPTPLPALSTNWQLDSEVTEVGKNADRARQLLWWVFSHPAIHSAPVLANLWGFSRNMVYVFIILVIIAFGLGLILSKSGGRVGPIFSGISSPLYGVNVPSILVKIGMILIYVTFSYLILLAFIQTSEVVMRFFIENVGGRDLFNVIFAGSGDSEANYISFIGYRDYNLLSNEMAHTSLFLIKTTSLTYNIIALILILRTVILWFLLIISPFLALLMPFVFIRNTGWIWMGVFFQWLFYGPLVALFMAALTKIWVFGIPYPFDFSRVNQPGGQVYKTAINILYGGPAQTLSPGNTANYIDTYAEYVIALVMLWAAIILPWWLLRIFRDYCCEAISSGNATLAGIFDRIRQYPPPPSSYPVVPKTSVGVAVELPFRNRVEEKVREVERTRIEEFKEISEVHTEEIAKAMDLSVSSLSDVSRLEMNQMKRSEIKKNLEKISTPETAASSAEKQRYAEIRSELKARATAGDSQAATILSASSTSASVLADQLMQTSGRSAVSRVRSSYAPTSTSGVNIPTSASIPALSQTSTISTIANRTSLKEEQVRGVLDAVQVMGSINTQSITTASKKAGVTEEKAKEVVAMAQTFAPTAASARKVAAVKPVPVMPVSIAGKTVQTQVSVEDYEEVKKMWLNHYKESPVPESEKIKNRQQWVTEEQKQLSNISNLLTSADPKLKKDGLEQVAEILPFMLLGGFSDVETITYIKAKLEAAKQVQAELEVAEKAKEEAKKEVKEEEETLLEVGEKKAEKKEAAAAGEQTMEIPKEETDKKK